MRANVVLPPLFGPLTTRIRSAIAQVKVVAHHRCAVTGQLGREREVERVAWPRRPSSELTCAGARTAAPLPSAARCTPGRRGRTGSPDRSGRRSRRDSCSCRAQNRSSLANVSGWSFATRSRICASTWFMSACSRNRARWSVDRTLLEFLERVLDLRAHVGLALVPAHPHPVAPEVNRVP